MANESGIQYLGDLGASGTVLGRNSAALLAFYGGTAATRPSGSGQASVTVTCGTASGSALVASLHSVATANRALVNQLRSDLVALGLIAGA